MRTHADELDLLAAASPITYVTSCDPPFPIVHGELDEVHPLHQARTFEVSLAGVGVPATLQVVPGASQVSSYVFDQTVREIVPAFLAK